MALTYIKMTKDGGVARITFNRPKHNMLSIPMLKELNSALETLIQDSELTCLVFLGEGPSWCAGVDVADHEPERVYDMIAVFNQFFELIDKMEITTIAAVHGACLGGGMEVAIACDIIIAGRNALFGQPEVKLAFFPSYAAIRLPKLVGQAKAVEICTTGKRYSAEDAQRIGFVSQVVDNDSFSDELEKLLREIKTNSPLIVRLNKRAIKQNLDKNFASALQDAGELFLNTLMKTEDTQEGIKSYFDKRKPEWKNR